MVKFSYTFDFLWSHGGVLTEAQSMSIAWNERNTSNRSLFSVRSKIKVVIDCFLMVIMRKATVIPFPIRANRKSERHSMVCY